MALAFAWIFGIGLNASYMIPTTIVSWINPKVWMFANFHCILAQKVNQLAN